MHRLTLNDQYGAIFFCWILTKSYSRVADEKASALMYFGFKTGSKQSPQTTFQTPFSQLSTQTSITAVVTMPHFGGQKLLCNSSILLDQ